MYRRRGSIPAMFYIVIAIFMTGTAMARTLYVDASVATTGDGSLASPFKTIGEAITASAAVDEIRIASGTYDNEPAHMTLKGQQIIRGSYDNAFTTSDPSATPTIIDMAHLTQQQQNRTFRCQAVTSFTIENLIIKNSSTGESGNTTNGGAIYVRNGSSGLIRGVSFIHCTSKFEGGVESGPARDGGAVCIRDASTVVIEDCVFDSCTAVGNGGAICMRNAGAGNNVKIRRCLFSHCGSRNGASAIQDADGVSQIEIVNCIFANNGVDVVVPTGIAPSHCEIRVADRRALLYNCTFVGSHNPDGFMFDMRDSSDAAAAKEIINCIIAHNTIASGGSVFAVFGYASGYNDVTTLQNNLFFSNSGLDPLDPTGTNILDANGNIAGEPQFADMANGDYHLKSDSPGEDAAQTLAFVSDDFAGTARPVGSAYDIGAMEGQASLNPLAYKVRSVMATASSSLNADSRPEKTVDGSGLNALGRHDTKIANMWTNAIGQQTPVWIQYEFNEVYKLDQMWVWNSNSELEGFLGWGVKTATIEYSTDGATWTALANVPEFAQGPGAADYDHNTTVDFGVVAKFVRMTCTSSWGGGEQYGLSEVRFFYIPVSARNPTPATEATGVPLDTTLSWKAGREAVSHEIHLSTDMQTVTDSTTPVATVSQATYAPANLNLGTTYYWKIVEVNDAMEPSVWTGDVWSFTTLKYIVVDDMESYNDGDNAIYKTWIDGYGTTTNGSQVGKDAPPYAEKSIVHGSSQSMPFKYNNTSASNSEATRKFEPAQNWTRGGAKTLVIYFRGNSANTIGQLYVKIGNTKIPYRGADTDLTTETWTPWEIDLASSGASLANVSTLSIGIDGNNASGLLYIDDIQLE